MRFPELIFGIIVLVLIGYLIWSSKKNNKRFLLKIIMSVLIVAFSWIWFIPTYVGQRGENAVCKFRFQVIEYDADDYGYGTWKGYFFDLKPSKYGTLVLRERVGGWKEYFGFKKAQYQTYEEYFGKEKK